MFGQIVKQTASKMGAAGRRGISASAKRMSAEGEHHQHLVFEGDFPKGVVLGLTLLQLLLLGVVAVQVLEEVHLLDVVGLDGFAARLPVGGAHLVWMRGRVLEGLEDAQRLVDAPAHGVVVDLDGADGALWVDDEESAQRGAEHLVLLVRDQHAVVLGDALADVGDQRDVHLAQAALAARRLDPGQVRVVRVGGDGHDLGVDAAELVHAVAEAHDLRGAHEREVERVEEQDEPLALVVAERHLLELLVDHGVHVAEVGRRLARRFLYLFLLSACLAPAESCSSTETSSRVSWKTRRRSMSALSAAEGASDTARGGAPVQGSTSMIKYGGRLCALVESHHQLLVRRKKCGASVLTYVCANPLVQLVSGLRAQLTGSAISALSDVYQRIAARTHGVINGSNIRKPDVHRAARSASLVKFLLGDSISTLLFTVRLPATKMATFRVLCLHGFGQDAPKFRNRISSLRRALKSSFDFGTVIATAPILDDQLPELDAGRAGQNWWDFEIDEETGKHTYGRVDEAVDYLAEFVKREGPFDGIFGFSQGGMMASLLLQRQFADPNNSPFKFKFAIFVASCDLGDPEYKSEQKVDVPSIHIMGETDAIVTMDRSQKLLELYNSPKVFVHPGGHYIPTSKEPKDALREFAKEMTAVYGAK
ncbi:hypothetical protein ON010_g2924 [Phytophthora cinnamomi]|nr:hypothetical protein ON010_g2924 [Phytophthora cinnamomi]